MAGACPAEAAFLLLLISSFSGVGAILTRQTTAGSVCSCKAVNQYIQHKPPEVEADVGQALPDCFPESKVDMATFGTPQSTLDTCLLQDGFGKETLESKLKCLAPDGVVGKKTAPAFYIVGDSHSMFMRDVLRSATKTPVYGASWWGSHHPGKVADIMDALGQVVQAGDLIGLSMRWDSRGLDEYLADVKLLTDLIAAKQASLVLFEDNPIMKANPSTCYMKAAAGAYPTECARDYSEVQAAYKAHNDAIATLTQSTKGVYYFPIVANLCDSSNGKCDFNVPGSWAPAYRDDNHLSKDAARYLAPMMCSFLNTAGLGVGFLHD
eukprot:TRINITY_DN16231_c0_g1_i2.p1 TRINITY_DN16231_c0_g1~~TRINITY_DN16231_c0_g1_i2.p1  ORF type:complete len:323 (+),score=59.46 TRINITY_DN16231_c0_g1_i2:83-1051(+)